MFPFGSGFDCMVLPQVQDKEHDRARTARAFRRPRPQPRGAAASRFPVVQQRLFGNRRGRGEAHFRAVRRVRQVDGRPQGFRRPPFDGVRPRQCRGLRELARAPPAVGAPLGRASISTYEAARGR